MSYSFVRVFFGMVFEHLWDAFHLEHSVTNFIQLHQLSSHVAMGHFPGSIVCILDAIRIWALAKPSGGIKAIVMG
jgi:hypothetical protein